MSQIIQLPIAKRFERRASGSVSEKDTQEKIEVEQLRKKLRHAEGRVKEQADEISEVSK